MDIGGTVALGFELVWGSSSATSWREARSGPRAACTAAANRWSTLWGGTTTADGDAPYTDRTLQLVASATKGALAIVAHRLAE